MVKRIGEMKEIDGIAILKGVFLGVISLPLLGMLGAISYYIISGSEEKTRAKSMYEQYRQYRIVSALNEREISEIHNSDGLENIVAGDFNADGTKEYVFLSGNNMYYLENGRSMEIISILGRNDPTGLKLQYDSRGQPEVLLATYGHRDPYTKISGRDQFFLVSNRDVQTGIDTGDRDLRR